jgi:putative endonuclease
MEKGHYTYMLRCADNTIYSGYAVDPIARLEKHNSGKGAKYTRARRPVKLVYFEKFENKGDALRREIEFKKLSRAEKEKMIENFKL